MAEHYAGLGLLGGVLAAFIVAWHLARRSDIATRHIVWIGVLALAGEWLVLPLVRTYAVRLGLGAEWMAWALPTGNLYVAAGFAVLPPLVYCVLRHLPLARLADVWAPAALLLLAGVRVDCFLRGCCWGDVCCEPAVVLPVLAAAGQWQVYTVPTLCGAGWPLAVTFPHGSPAHTQHVLLGFFSGPSLRSLPCHPVQLYEAAGAAVLALLLVWRYPHRRFPLAIWCWAVGGYGVLRFFMEFLRADHEAAWHCLTGVQVISVIVVACVALCYAAARQMQRTDPTDRTDQEWAVVR
jgi:prolipoprotein diacylglyceryltransferase